MGKSSHHTSRKRDVSSSPSSSEERSRRKKKEHRRSRSRNNRRPDEGSRRNNSRDRRRSKDRRGGGGNKNNRRDDFRFDSPPKDHELSSGIMAAAASMGGGILQSIQSMSMAQTAKIDRKLYVGNLPSGVTQRMLVDIVNEAMLALQILEEPGNPVVSTWISSDGHYAFVEFRTAEEANHGFQLQGMNIQGYEIKIGRPKAYSGTMNALGLMSQINSLQYNDGKNQHPAAAALLQMKAAGYQPLDETAT